MLAGLGLARRRQTNPLRGPLARDGLQRLSSLRFKAAFYFVIVQVAEAKETIAARIALDWLHMYCSGCELGMSCLNFVREKNGMLCNVRLHLPPVE